MPLINIIFWNNPWHPAVHLWYNIEKYWNLMSVIRVTFVSSTCHYYVILGFFALYFKRDLLLYFDLLILYIDVMI